MAHRRLSHVFAAGVAGVVAVAALGQQIQPPGVPAAPPAAAAPAVEPTPQEQIETRRAEVAKDLTEARDRLARSEASGTTPSPQLGQEVELLERIERLLGQQLATIPQEAEQQPKTSELARQLDALKATGPDQQPPYPFLDLERARDKLAATRKRLERVDAGVQAAREALDQAKRVHEERERARRAAREAADRSNTPELAAQLRLARLESRVADETARLRERELVVERGNQTLERLQLEIDTETVRWLERGTHFSATDLREIKLRLATAEQTLRRELQRAEEDVQAAEARLLDARRRHEAAGPDDRALAEEVEARRLAQDASRRRTRSLTQRLEWQAAINTAWERRHAVENKTADKGALRGWLSEADAQLAALDIAGQLEAADLNDLRNAMIAIGGKAEDSTGPTARWLGEQKAALERMQSLLEANVAAREQARRVHKRLAEEIRRETDRVSIGERFSAAWQSVKAVWNYEITSIDDRPITVGKVFIALFILVTGIIVSRRLSLLLGRKLLRRVGFAEGGAAAIQSLAFYALILAFGLLALRLANVPMTAFTILGGALAIGAGFGSQTIIKNFLSGLILIAERPIRVGDLIQLGDLYGTVEHVGARSTRVRTGDNVEIVVPNGAFLEQNVINWTLSETRVRVSVAVGVVYGSPTREVSRLLTKAVTEHGRVLKHPAPIVLFTEFGDNSLNFEIHFWINMRSMMDRRLIESDIRFRIDNLFREAHIVIAFPQRDVHLDSIRPVEVRVVADGETAAPPALTESFPAGDGEAADAVNPAR